MASPEGPDSREFRQMRHDVDDAYRLLTVVQKTVESTRETLGTVWAVQRRHGTRLEEIQQSLDLQAGRLDRMEETQHQQGERLGRVEGRLDGVDGRLEGVEGRLGGVEGRLEGVDGRLEGVDGRLEGVEGRLEGVDGRLEGVDGRLERIADTQQQILDLLRGSAG
jgi:chromosome segregation ATPase